MTASRSDLPTMDPFDAFPGFPATAEGVASLLLLALLAALLILRRSRSRSRAEPAARISAYPMLIMHGHPSPDAPADGGNECPPRRLPWGTLLDELASLGVPESEVRTLIDSLSKRGVAAPSPDPIREAAFEVVRARADLKEDWETLHRLHRYRAQHAKEKGEPFLPSLLEAQRSRLLSLGRSGVRQARISAHRCCPTCAKNDGTVVQVDEASRNMPLPCPQCETICSCMYEPA